MKRNDVISILGLFLLFSYIGYREYLIQNFLEETEAKISATREEVLSYLKTSIPSEVQEFSSDEATLGNIQKENLKNNTKYIDGYFCAKEGDVLKFDRPDENNPELTLTIWRDASSSINLAESKKPTVVGTYKLRSNTIRMKYKTQPGDPSPELEFQIEHMIINETDPNDEDSIISLIDPEDDSYAKEICLD
jgi:hypothetical protein